MSRINDLWGNINAALTGKALGYSPPPNLIGHRVLPLVTFNSLKVELPVYDKSGFQVVEPAARPLYGNPETVTVSRTYQTYDLEEVTLGARVDVRERTAAAFSALPWDPLEKATMNAKRMVLTRREKKIADLLQNSSNYGYSVTTSSGSGWNEKTGGVSNVNPLEILDNVAEQVVAKIGVRPNVLVLGSDAWRALKLNTKVHDTLFGSVNPGMPTQEMVRSYLQLDELFVGMSVYYDGTNFLPMWGDFAALLYRPPSGLADMVPSYGFTAIASWGQSGDQDVLGVVTEWQLSPYVTEVDYTEFVKPHVAMPEAGALILDVVK